MNCNRKARKKLALLRIEVTQRKKISAKTVQTVCKTFDVPIASYSIQFCPLTDGLKKRVGNARKRKSLAPLRLYFDTKLSRLRNMMRLPHLERWNSIRLQSLNERLEKRCIHITDDAKAALDMDWQDCRLDGADTITKLDKESLESLWNGEKERHQQKLPMVAEKIIVAPVFRNWNKTVQVCAVRWYCDLFPRTPRVLIDSFEPNTENTNSVLKAITADTVPSPETIKKAMRLISIQNSRTKELWKSQNGTSAFSVLLGHW